MFSQIDAAARRSMRGFEMRPAAAWPREAPASAPACAMEALEQRVLQAGDGLEVTYWNNASSNYASSLNFSGSSVSRIDANINANWGSGSPAAAIDPNTFSARWTGQIAIPATATYTFYTTSDDGVKLWVNGVLLIDSWPKPTSERSGSITLAGGQRYDIRLEYYENTGAALCQLRWSSPGIAKTLVPQSVLYSTVPAPPLPGNWNLTFADEFNTAPASPTWVQTIWGLRNTNPSELETYRSSAVTVSNGVLNLTATKDASGGKQASYTSGMINTGGIAGKTAPGYAFTYGYVEARMKLPQGQGLWSAFWMLPAPTPSGQYHDADGEIDIAEVLGQEPANNYVHLHHGGVWGKAYNTGVDLSKSFHTYGLDWEPDHLTWYFDGQPIYTHVGDSPAVPEYVILNLAVGGDWPGSPDSSTPFPAVMQVDYVHVFQQGAPA